MHRMSDPQIVEALTRRRTSPWLGMATGYSRSLVVLSPGRTAPCIVVGMALFIALFVVGLGGASFHVPKILPALGGLPEENLSLYEPAVAVDSRYQGHLLRCERILDGRPEISRVVARVRRHRDRDLAALNRPFDADGCRMHVVGPRDAANYRIV